MFKNSSYKTIVSTIYLMAILMEIIDVTIINVALPQIQTSLSASMKEMGWITNGYILSLATAIPISSWLGERFGTKKILILGIGLFTFASFWCGISNSIYSLIFARLLQGIGGGMLVPVGQTILFRAYEPSELPTLLSRLAIPITLAPALGQTLGGFIVAYSNWHWIFLVNIPFGILCLLGTYIYLKESETKTIPLDFIGLSISCLAIFILFYAFSIVDFEINLLIPLIYAIISCILFWIFVKYEQKCKYPFFNLAVFKDRNFSLSIFCNLLIFSNIIGTFFISNFIFQETIGWTALESGLTAIPFSLGFLIAFKTVPKIYPNKFSGKSILIATNICCILACFLMIFINSVNQFRFCEQSFLK